MMNVQGVNSGNLAAAPKCAAQSRLFVLFCCVYRSDKHIVIKRGVADTEFKRSDVLPCSWPELYRHHRLHGLLSRQSLFLWKFNKYIYFKICLQK